jgi:Family of unknown function (DUF5335)
MALRTRQIPRHRWREELDSLSSSHEGWLVRVNVTSPNGAVETAARDIPLRRVSALDNGEAIIAVDVGRDATAQMTHEVLQPVEVVVEETETAAVASLIVRSSDGTRTAVEFRSAMRPEEVDGVA